MARLSRLSALVPIADSRGLPTPLFLRYFNALVDQVNELTVPATTTATPPENPDDQA